MELGQVHETRLAERESAEFRFRRAGAGMVPGTDDEIVSRSSLRRGVPHVLAIVRQRSGLIVIIAAGDREDRNGELGVLLGGRIVGVPVRVGMRMGEPFLEDRRGIAEHDVEVLEGPARLEPAAICRFPELRVAKDPVLRGVAAGEGQPLHVVGIEDVVLHREVDAGVGRGDRHDGREVRRDLLRGRPLIVARVRAAPHRNLAVAVGLLRQPFDDVVAVPRFLDKGMKLAFRVAAAADVNREKGQSRARQSRRRGRDSSERYRE